MVRLESAMPGTVLASTVARLSEPVRNSCKASRSSTMVCCTGLTRLLDVRDALTSIGAITVAPPLAASGSMMVAEPSCRSRSGLPCSSAASACCGVIAPDSAGACMPATVCGA